MQPGFGELQDPHYSERGNSNRALMTLAVNTVVVVVVVLSLTHPTVMIAEFRQHLNTRPRNFTDT